MSNRTDWDAIVIGAGLAGLSCAAYLAKAGKAVLVLEQHSRPGGLWTSFLREDVVFDLSAHWVTDPQALNSMLDELGAPPVDFAHLENLGRYLGPPTSTGAAGGAGVPASPRTAAATPAWDITVGEDVNAFKESVRASFPTVATDALERLVQEALALSRLLDSLPAFSPESATLWARCSTGLRMLRPASRLRRLSRMPAEDYFADLFPGDALAGLRAALYTLAPIPGISALGPLAILGTALRGRAYSPRGGAQVLADAFERAALLNGAEIRYSSKVVSILTANRAVRGVSLNGGAVLTTPVVVSAADAKQTFYRLLGREHIPDSYQKLLEAQPVSEPYGLISLVTTLEPAAVGFDGTDVFVCPSVDVPRVLEEKDPQRCAFSVVFSRYAGPGADPALRGLQVVVPAAWAWREHWETWPTPERGVAYRALKEEWSTAVLLRVQEYLPRLASHVVSMDVATPITFHRYTLNTEGAPVGWHYTSRQRWKQRVPFVRGLYQAGHWVGPSGAIAVTRSGKWAAELVRRDDKGS